MTQTSPPSTPGLEKDQGTDACESEEDRQGGKVSCAADTSDLEEALKGLTITNPCKEDLVGRRGVELEGDEGGLGDIIVERDNILGGWEMVLSLIHI